jgi:Coenzyme PQQ synthesis protein D (PqqD)
MKLNKNIAVSDTGYIFNPTNGDSFSCNPVGSDIISLLKDGVDKAGIISYIIEKYDVNQRTVERDLEDFLIQMQDSYLIGHEQ